MLKDLELSHTGQTSLLYALAEANDQTALEADVKTLELYVFRL